MSFLEQYGDRYSCTELTEAINNIDSGFGIITKSGLFTGKSIKTTTVSIEYSEGRLTVLADRDRDGETVYQRKRNRKPITFNMPFFPYSKPIKASDVQDIRKFGTTDELESIDSVIEEYQTDARYNHDVTLEFMEIGALLGKVMDGEGNVIADLYKKFDVAQPTATFNWGKSTFDLPATCRSILRMIKKGMRGDVYTGVEAKCSPTFWDNLMADENFQKAYQFYLQSNPMRDDVRDGFSYMGIVWSEYSVSASKPNGDELEFIPDGEAVFYPVGSKNTFRYFKAPGDFIEAANTMGIDMYSKIWENPNGRGMTLETQSSRLPINMRPLAVVKGVKGANS